jgi:hypothetical protein
MRRTVTLTLAWTARALALAMAMFLASFARDASSEPNAMAIAFAVAVHLVPPAIVLLIAAIGWRRPGVAGSLFLLLAGAYAVSVGMAHYDWILVIAGPLALVGALFVASAWSARLSVSRPS